MSPPLYASRPRIFAKFPKIIRRFVIGAGNARTLESGDSRFRGNGERGGINKTFSIPAKAGISLFLGQGGQRTHCNEFGAGDARTLESGDSRFRGNGERGGNREILAFAGMEEGGGNGKRGNEGADAKINYSPFPRKFNLLPIPAKAGISLFLGRGGQRTHCTEFGAGNARTLESGDSRFRGNGERGGMEEGAGN